MQENTSSTLSQQQSLHADDPRTLVMPFDTAWLDDNGYMTKAFSVFDKLDRQVREVVGFIPYRPKDPYDSNRVKGWMPGMFHITRERVVQQMHVIVNLGTPVHETVRATAYIRPWDILVESGWSSKLTPSREVRLEQWQLAYLQGKPRWMRVSKLIMTHPDRNFVPAHLEHLLADLERLGTDALDDHVLREAWRAEIDDVRVEILDQLSEDAMIFGATDRPSGNVQSYMRRLLASPVLGAQFDELSEVLLRPPFSGSAGEAKLAFLREELTKLRVTIMADAEKSLHALIETDRN